MSYPVPQVESWQGCPPNGDGGDPALNYLKNRVDLGNWHLTPIEHVIALPYPSAIAKTKRAVWAPADAAAIALYEGAPLMVEGYLAGAHVEGPESCSCHSITALDFHLWLVADLHHTRTDSLVCELSPRVRHFHPTWAFSNIEQIVAHKERVRLGGWLLMDQDHPEQLGKTRATLWELHPVMELQAYRQGVWVTL